MRNEYTIDGYGSGLGARLGDFGVDLPRKALIGVILMVALLAFEIFNFDTTRYALRNLMGEITFLGFQWAAILALAFCSIDFAGLVRLFTPERGQDEPKEVWYLMGAWLLGATMNALMTWWAVSLTLLNHDFGNEVLSREQLLEIVPIFVAVLVWLTRILFIGAFTVAGEHLFDLRSSTAKRMARPAQPVKSLAARPAAVKSRPAPRPPLPRTSDDLPGFLRKREHGSTSQPVTSTPPLDRNEQPIRHKPKRPRNHSRIQQRPPMPNGVRRVPFNGVQASPRRRN